VQYGHRLARVAWAASVVLVDPAVLAVWAASVVLVGPVVLAAWAASVVPVGRVVLAVWAASVVLVDQAASAERAGLVVQRVRPSVRAAVLKASVVRSAKAARSEA
jgi:hypothetical protein